MSIKFWIFPNTHADQLRKKENHNEKGLFIFFTQKTKSTTQILKIKIIVYYLGLGSQSQFKNAWTYWLFNCTLKFKPSCQCPYPVSVFMFMSMAISLPISWPMSMSNTVGVSDPGHVNIHVRPHVLVRGYIHVLLFRARVHVASAHVLVSVRIRVHWNEHEHEHDHGHEHEHDYKHDREHEN